MPGRGDDAAPGDPSVGYRHVGRLGTLDELSTDALLAHLRPRVAAGDPVVLACNADLTATLVAGLPDRGVLVVDEALLGGRAPEALAGYTALVDQHLPADDHRLQLVTDSRHDGLLTSWLQTEALLNHVLVDRPVDHVCLLDHTDLGADTGTAVACHPVLLLDDGGLAANPGWREPADLLRDLAQTPGPDPLESTDPAVDLVDTADMRRLRRALQAALAGGPLPADDAEDLVLAIDEVTANATEHGVPPVDVRLWVTAEQVLCTISDRGSGFDEPLAGYGPAHGTDLSVGGMGLWLARRAVDTMTTAPLTPDGSGCVVRLTVDPRQRPRA